MFKVEVLEVGTIVSFEDFEKAAKEFESYKKVFELDNSNMDGKILAITKEKEVLLEWKIPSKNKVILSTPLLLETGVFEMQEVSLEFAKDFAKVAKNFVGHSTIRILGIEPSTSREVCNCYEQALVLKVNGRLDFGKEYSVEEIEEIGYKIFLIRK